MDNTRSAGVLLHISSLPGKYGIGSLGRRHTALQSALPVRASAIGRSCPSSRQATATLPISPCRAVRAIPTLSIWTCWKSRGLLTKKELRPLRRKGDVDYGALYTERYQTLRTAYSRFFFDSAEFRAYVDEGTHEDYALFMTAKTVFGGSFCDWEEASAAASPRRWKS